MEILQTTKVQCPYCWQQIDLLVDCSVSQQQYVEDCSVCCRPMVISVMSPDDDELIVEASME